MKNIDILFVELQAAVGRLKETERRVEQSERAIRQMEGMLENKRGEQEKTINIGEEIKWEHKG